MDYKRQQAEIQQIQQQPVQYQQQQQIQQQSVQTQPQRQIQGSQVYYQSKNQSQQLPNLRIDYNSIWLDKSQGMIGARVSNGSTGQISNYAYFMQQVNDNVINILESIDGSQWRQVGFVDFSYMTPANLGTEQTGGAIFGEIFNKVFNNHPPEEPKMLTTTTNSATNFSNNRSISRPKSRNSNLKKDSPFKKRFDMIDEMITKPHKSNENIKKELKKLEKEVERQRSGIAMRMIGDYYRRIKCEQEATSCYAKADSF